jgi:protein-tyrosine phosphatase
MRPLLFVCSGNYYRSRFAEAVFNFHAARLDAPLRAFSRGLAIHLVAGAGDLSPHTREALGVRGIPLRHTGPAPAALTLADLEGARRTIALKEAEHRPLMREQFPDWEDRVEYWSIHDIDAAAPADALPRLEERVLTLLRELREAR